VPVIRQASEQDAAVLSELIRASFRDVAERLGLTAENCPGHPSNCREQTVLKALAEGTRFFLLSWEGKDRACVSCSPGRQGVFTLRRLSVLPEARLRGFGKLLVRHAMDDAWQHGADCVEVGVVASEQWLIGFYERMGFAVTRENVSMDELPFEVTFLMHEFED
jgi:N-acetylglutamate synthase-like GNAT family acetyltransferase